MRATLSELAGRFGLTLKGPDAEITGVNTLKKAGPDELSFLSNHKYAEQLGETRAAAVIVEPRFADRVERALVTENPYLALARVSQLFAAPQGCLSGVSDLAFIHPDAEVDEAATIYPFAFVGARARVAAGATVFPHCYVGEDASVGEGTILYPGVVVMAGVTVGRECILHPGAVVGSDGFGYAQGPEGHVKVPQTGPVVMGDRVDVGANTTVDRGSLGETRLGTGAKIDNLVQIAHNVAVGEHSIIIAQAGISGSTTLGRGVIILGQAGLTGHIHVGDGSIIGSQAGLGWDVPAGSRLNGTPAYDHGTFLRNAAIIPKLPDMYRRLKKLEKELAALKAGEAGDADDA